MFLLAKIVAQPIEPAAPHRVPLGDPVLGRRKRVEFDTARLAAGHCSHDE